MRLIDADALIMQMNDGPYNCPGDCGACEMDGIIIDGRKLIACSAVTHTPTIDAIPVEWLENRLNTLCFEAMGAGALYGDRIGELAKSINEVMKLWQKEQEAR